MLSCINKDRITQLCIRAMIIMLMITAVEVGQSRVKAEVTLLRA